MSHSICTCNLAGASGLACPTHAAAEVTVLMETPLTPLVYDILFFLETLVSLPDSIGDDALDYETIKREAQRILDKWPAHER